MNNDQKDISKEYYSDLFCSQISMFTNRVSCSIFIDGLIELDVSDVKGNLYNQFCTSAAYKSYFKSVKPV